MQSTPRQPPLINPSDWPYLQPLGEFTFALIRETPSNPPPENIPPIIARLKTYLDPTHKNYQKKKEYHDNIRRAIEGLERGDVGGGWAYWGIDFGI
ncbi:hypothetical protein V494_03969 [Pseudogymnoascus sp. VKM F-4513 (FW-928)]|nr:hypothetical protein V494_03969 [Pseudogymnoascus sp. VKM F-4513 (FW-928)]